MLSSLCDTSCIHTRAISRCYQPAHRINYHAGERARESDYLAVEGEELKRLAAVNALEKERLEAVRKAEAATLMTDNVRQIDDVRRMRDVQKAQDEVRDFTGYI